MCREMENTVFKRGEPVVHGKENAVVLTHEMLSFTLSKRNVC